MVRLQSNLTGRAGRLIAALGGLLWALSGCVAFPSEEEIEATGAHASALVGGALAPTGAFPATGALLRERRGGRETICTGTLIAQDAVLTAAHCVDPQRMGAELPQFALGANLQEPEAVSSRPAREAQLFPEWNGASSSSAADSIHDIALLFLQPREAEDPREQVDGLADAALDKVPGGAVQIVGYGRSELYGDEHAGTGIQRAGVAHLTQINGDTLELGEPGDPTACNGDSGGPAILEQGDGTRRIIGIASRASDNDHPCAGAALYTRVDAYAKWIHDLLGNHEASAQSVLAAPQGGIAPAWNSPACSMSHPNRGSIGWDALLLLGVSVARGFFRNTR